MPKQRATPEERSYHQDAIDSLDFDAVVDEVEPPRDLVIQLSERTKRLAGLDEDAVFVIPADQGTPSYTVKDLQLTFPTGLPYEVWERDTLRLIAVGKRITWLIADALAYGEGAYGERHAQVYDLTSWSKQTLRNITYIARAIPPERRRDDVAFSIQAVTASLPADQQVAVITQAAEQNWTRVETQDAVNTLKRQAKREQARLQLPTGPLPDRIFLSQGDARALKLPADSIDAIITSPPYGIEDQESGAGVAKYAVSDDWRDWQALIQGFLDEAVRVLKPSGRLVVVLPIDTSVGGVNGGQRPLYAELVRRAQDAGLTYATTISWDEGNVSKRVARGSVGLPSAPRIINRQEMIAVFCKGQWKRELTDTNGQRLTSDLSIAESVAWSDGVWVLPGESNGWEGFRAAYPLALASRLLSLFTFQEDTVCDPFLGSGTTALAALLGGRTFVGIDIDQEMVASTRRRLSSAAQGGSR